MTAPTYCRSPRIAFFTYPEWAFGSIHEGLSKELYKVGIFSTLLDWNTDYSNQEFERLTALYDAFVTSPGLAVELLLQYGVPYSKIVAIAHEVSDIQSGLIYGNDYSLFKAYAVINPSLQRVSKSLGIDREAFVVQNGIHFDYFYQPVPHSLETLGYAGSFQSFMIDGVTDRKRGYLSLQLASSANLKYSRAVGYGYRSMPMFYNSVDAIVMTSLQEACGLPMMEAAASGRLPMGTSTGILELMGEDAGVILPVGELEFLARGLEELNFYKKDRDSFIRKCKLVQEFARVNYDWTVVLPLWVQALS